MTLEITDSPIYQLLRRTLQVLPAKGKHSPRLVVINEYTADRLIEELQREINFNFNPEALNLSIAFGVEMIRTTDIPENIIKIF